MSALAATAAAAPAAQHVPAVAVRPLTDADAARWDAFVADCPEASFFHRAGWKRAIERAYRHRTHYLFAEAGGRIEGVVPLAEVRSLLFGHTLSSTPFCVYGGVAATTERARRALEDAAEQLALDLGVGYLEMRNQAPRRSDWAGKDLYVTFRREIDPDVERNLNLIPRKQRAMVRKGVKAGLKGELDDGVDRLFAAYSDSVHRLGTPVFPKRWFAILRDEFGPDCEVLTVTLEGRLIASVMSFYFRDQVLPYYGGGTAEARGVAGNDFMYWELMRRACERGLRWFDYGRSKRGTGSFDFKKNWGFEPEPLHYEYRLVKAAAVPDHNPLNPKYRMFIRGWQTLPLPVANWLGPHIVKNLG